MTDAELLFIDTHTNILIYANVATAPLHQTKQMVGGLKS